MMKYYLMCKRTLLKSLRHPLPYLSLYLFWAILCFFTVSGRLAAAFAQNGFSTLCGGLSALALHSAVFLRTETETSVLLRLKAAGCSGFLLLGSYLAAFLLTGAAAALFFCVPLMLTGLPPQSNMLLLPPLSVLPALFYVSLGILCGSLLGRNGLWLVCALGLTVCVFLGSGIVLAQEGGSPFPLFLSYLPSFVFTRVFRSGFALAAKGEEVFWGLAAGYALSAALLSFRVLESRFSRL